MSSKRLGWQVRKIAEEYQITMDEAYAVIGARLALINSPVATLIEIYEQMMMEEGKTFADMVFGPRYMQKMGLV